MKNPILKDLNAVIVTHVFATGPPQELEEYLKSRVNTLMYIGHPFSFSKERRSFYRMYMNGELKKESSGIALKDPELLVYFKDFVYTLYWTIEVRKHFDIFVGVDPLNCYAGLFINRIKKIPAKLFCTRLITFQKDSEIAS